MCLFYKNFTETCDHFSVGYSLTPRIWCNLMHLFTVHRLVRSWHEVSGVF